MAKVWTEACLAISPEKSMQGGVIHRAKHSIQTKKQEKKLLNFNFAAAFDLLPIIQEHLV